MKELKSRHYQARTEKNVLDADDTIIFTFNKIGLGSALTLNIAGAKESAAKGIYSRVD